jgi:hypothetical protein
MHTLTDLSEASDSELVRQLIAVLEEEVRVGEKLLHNLAAQREAILSWDSSALLERVEEKEVLVRKLGAMEERRQEIMAHLPCARVEKNLSLRELLAHLSLQDRKSLEQEELRVQGAKGQESRAQSQESRAKESGSKPLALSSKLSEPLALSHSVQDRLSHLQKRAWEVYSRLQAEEKRLVSLMETLLGHFREALSPLSHPSVYLYGKRGTPAHSRPESGLIQGKV